VAEKIRVRKNKKSQEPRGKSGRRKGFTRPLPTGKTRLHTNRGDKAGHTRAQELERAASLRPPWSADPVYKDGSRSGPGSGAHCAPGAGSWAWQRRSCCCTSLFRVLLQCFVFTVFCSL